jgi:hypothetical protein
MIWRKRSSASRNPGDDRRSLVERKRHRSIFETTAVGPSGNAQFGDGMATPGRATGGKSVHAEDSGYIRFSFAADAAASTRWTTRMN